MEDAYQKQISCLRELQIGARKKRVRVIEEIPKKQCTKPLYLYQVLIDFAGSDRKWQMFFDPDYPGHYPDFVFDIPFLLDASDLEPCDKWSLESTSSLPNLIVDLHHRLISYQRSKLKDYPQLQSEFAMLVSETKYGAVCEVDIIKKGPGTYNDTVKFVVPVDVDLSLLPPHSKESHPVENRCSLSLNFETPNQSQTNATLEIPRSVENALGGLSNLRIPDYGSSTLTQYVLKIEKLFSATVNRVNDRYQKRKALVTILLSTFYGSVLEYDSDLYFNVAFLLSINGFYFTLYVTLTEQYPLEQPLLYVQSIYLINNTLYKKSITGYRYDPSWSEQEKIEKVKSHLYENINKIKVECFRYG